MSGSKKLSGVIDLINCMKESQAKKNKMNELPIQGCLSEVDAQFNQYVTGEVTG